MPNALSKIYCKTGTTVHVENASSGLIVHMFNTAVTVGGSPTNLSQSS